MIIVNVIILYIYYQQDHLIYRSPWNTNFRGIFSVFHRRYFYNKREISLFAFRIIPCVCMCYKIYVIIYISYSTYFYFEMSCNNKWKIWPKNGVFFKLFTCTIASRVITDSEIFALSLCNSKSRPYRFLRIKYTLLYALTHNFAPTSDDSIYR